MAVRQGRPLLLIDLAVPRDIDASCGEIDGVSLFDIDDLQAVIARNRRVRQAEARKAEGIIEQEIQHFAAWLGSLEVLPTADRAATCTRPRSPSRSCTRTPASGTRHRPRDLERVDAMAQAIVNRLLHHPTARLRELHDDRVHARMALIRDLFGLEVETTTRSGPRRRGAAGRSARAAPPELIRVGTRGSALALAQARWVGERLGVRSTSW